MANPPHDTKFHEPLSSPVVEQVSWEFFQKVQTASEGLEIGVLDSPSDPKTGEIGNLAMYGLGHRFRKPGTREDLQRALQRIPVVSGPQLANMVWKEFARAKALRSIAGWKHVPGALRSRSDKARRGRKPSSKLRPLTPRQMEAVTVVPECKGNYGEAARRMGLDRKTVVQHYKAGMGKLGIKAVKHGTQGLPADRRGQANVTYEDDQRR